jgi:hypothetical protein
VRQKDKLVLLPGVTESEGVPLPAPTTSDGLALPAGALGISIYEDLPEEDVDEARGRITVYSIAGVCFVSCVWLWVALWALHVLARSTRPRSHYSTTPCTLNRATTKTQTNTKPQQKNKPNQQRRWSARSSTRRCASATQDAAPTATLMWFTSN